MTATDLVVVPQLRSLPVIVYGHSLTVSPAPWHTTGSHWTDRLLASGGPASVTRRGVGGSHLEQTCNLLGGAGGQRWNPGTTKTLALIQGVVNSAGTKWGTDQQSLDSIGNAAYHLAACVISDVYDFANAGWSYSNGSGAGWFVQGFADGRASLLYLFGAATYTANDPAWASFVVPAGVSNRHMWIEHLAFAVGGTEATVQVLKNGVEVFQGSWASTDLAPGGYSRHALPVGPIDAGDVIRIEKIGPAGQLWLLGALIENGRNHAVLVGDPDAHDSIPGDPAVTAKFQAHNAAVGSAVEDINALVPNAASFLDLGPSLDHVPAMLWSGDSAHPNDEGQAWFAVQYAQGLRDLLPWTTRLHTL